jgi:hypothetical protein
MSKMDATACAEVGIRRRRFTGKSDERPVVSLCWWNKNVLRDENDDNDVVAAAIVTQAASPRTSPRVGLVRHVRTSTHIRRPLRRSEHKCPIRPLDTFDL